MTLDLDRASEAFDEGKKLYLMVLGAEGAAARVGKEWTQRVAALEVELVDVKKQRDAATAATKLEVDAAIKALSDHQAKTYETLGIKLDFGLSSGGSTRL